MKSLPKSSLLARLTAFVVAALIATPALAATEASTGAWVSQHTDMNPADVVINGPEVVYSLQASGDSDAVGERVAFVRAEAVPDEFGETHGFRSWDANILFDCAGARMRVIRSAAHTDSNLKGQPVQAYADEAWRSPNPGQPAAVLLAAACDPSFAWPLRARKPMPELPSLWLPNVTPVADVLSGQAEAQATKPQAPSHPYAIQVAYGPFEDGARRALARTSRLLKSASNGLAAVTEPSVAGGKPRFTVMIGGFPSVTAATEACRKLVRAGQSCLTRRAPPSVLAALAPSATPDAEKGRWSLAKAAISEGSPHLVQIARGPFEDGAKRALAKARIVLGAQAQGLTGTTEMSRRGRHIRYAALLTGFPSAAAAEQACRTLMEAGHACLHLARDRDPPKTALRA